jgi:hypothetical protein
LVAAAAQRAASDGVDFTRWQEDMVVEADISGDGDWEEARILAISVEEDEVQ